MKILLDNEERELNDQLLLMGEDISGRRCPVADHTHLKSVPFEGRENMKVITSGHVYILNYNKNTYVPKNALTFDQYLKLKSEEKEYL